MTLQSKPVHRRGEWGKKFADLMRQERQERKLALQDYPKWGKYQEDVEHARQVPDLAYLLRLIIWYRHKNVALPSGPRLRAILICWALARLERWPESKTFREDLVLDYEELTKPERDAYRDVKEAFKKEVERLFPAVWEQRGGPEAREYFQNILAPAYEKFIGGDYEDVITEELLQADKDLQHSLPTLDRFPKDFQPLVVIVGGYYGKIDREPEHLSDLFRQAQSFSNLYYLLRLGLPKETEIVTDRLLLDLHDENERADFLGNKHVLVIGSPLVNIVSRHLVLNKKLVFNFVFGKKTYQLGKNFYDHTIARRNDEWTKRSEFDEGESIALLRKLIDARSDEFEKISKTSGLSLDDKAFIQHIVLDIRSSLGDPDANHELVTEQFRPSNLFSPFNNLLLNSSADSFHEHGLISVGENIWSMMQSGEKPKHALVLVSGVNELSTSIALRALSERDTFVEHPLGGILEIKQGTGSGPKRITGGTPKWLTRGYVTADLLAKIDEVLERFTDRPSAYELFDTKEELEQYRGMVTQYFDSTAALE